MENNEGKNKSEILKIMESEWNNMNKTEKKNVLNDC